MNWLRARFQREGPGIPKDAPKKRGLALFAQIVVREAWDLFKLNLMIVVFCLPIITIPAAHAAATRICISMVRDENTYLWRDFWQAFCRHFKAATAWGLVSATVLGLSGYAAFIYGQLAIVNFAFAAAATLCVMIWVFVLALTAHVFVLLVEKPDLAPYDLARRAALAMLGRPWPILAAFAFIASLWLLHIVFYPVSVFMPAAFNFSLATLSVTFSALKASDKDHSQETGRRPICETF
ncbi:YesL family protein [Rhizobium oryziradicis]|uniref:DUF624 domain-containing protein n=1 Tax=Rhizobium oryziradicis TaxID=1867956 RepID=A0A1Q8ZXP9_9HYPH|nr:YesL family protein [Rhizobium oryziradicis]OLP46763.1 hypothetical protein BJF95_15730 [Rhizobium oryziradicis]